MPQSPILYPLTQRGIMALEAGVKTAKLTRTLWLAYRAYRGDPGSAIQLLAIVKRRAKHLAAEKRQGDQ